MEHIPWNSNRPAHEVDPLLKGSSWQSLKAILSDDRKVSSEWKDRAVKVAWGLAIIAMALMAHRS